MTWDAYALRDEVSALFDDQREAQERARDDRVAARVARAIERKRAYDLQYNRWWYHRRMAVAGGREAERERWRRLWRAKQARKQAARAASASVSEEANIMRVGTMRACGATKKTRKNHAHLFEVRVRARDTVSRCVRCGAELRWGREGARS